MTDWTSEPPTVPPTSPASAPPPPTADGLRGDAERDRTGGRGRGRTVAGIVLALIAGFSAIAGFMSFWATDEILSSSTWESTGRAIVEDPAARREVSRAIAEQIIEAVGLESLVAGVLPGPLSGLSGTISDKVTELLTDATVQVVRTEFFQGVWEQAVAAVHDQFVRAVDGSGGVTSITAKGIELELSGVVGAIQEQLDRRGITVLDSIDPSRIDVSYLLIDAPGLQNVRSWIRTLRILVIILPAVAVIGAIAAFVIGRRRSFVAAALGAGGLLGAAVVGLVLRTGKAQAVEDLSGGAISPVTADAVVTHISSGLRGALFVSGAVALVVLVVGIVAAIVTTPTRSSRT